MAGPDADPDRDGRSNLSEYAFLGDPLVADPEDWFEVSIVTVDGEDYAALTFPYEARARDLNYRLESSGDLESWSGEWGLRLTEDGEFHHNRELVVAKPRDRGYPAYVVRGKQPVSDARHSFLRVAVTRER